MVPQIFFSDLKSDLFKTYCENFECNALNMLYEFSSNQAFATFKICDFNVYVNRNRWVIYIKHLAPRSGAKILRVLPNKTSIYKWWTLQQLKDRDMKI